VPVYTLQASCSCRCSDLFSWHFVMEMLGLIVFCCIWQFCCCTIIGLLHPV
jgi:hypothetical protein